MQRTPEELQEIERIKREHPELGPADKAKLLAAFCRARRLGWCSLVPEKRP